MKLTCRTLALATAMGSLPFAVAAQDFNVPSGDLKAALDSYKAQSGVSLFIPRDAVRGVQTRGVRGDMPPDEALTRLLRGTGFTARRDSSGVIAIIHDQQATEIPITTPDITLAQATPSQRAGVETVTVTSSKLGGADVQSIPIAITALSQEQLTATQTNGGPDLVKQVPNLTFTKTNFSGYSIQIRGIGTQAISVATDPAVAVAMNDVPFIRNHFFEQEFFDVGQVEVLRGPQGTLYGRNATAGVVNLVSAKPTDQFEVMASAEVGNYHQRRLEGMINLPIVDDRLDIRFAGEWTKRQGYSFNENTNQRIDGRDLWSGRLTIGFKPMENLQAYLVWEHFQESDDRMRSAKQLCKTDPTPTSINGTPVPQASGGYSGLTSYVSQGCEAASLYSPESFEVPNGFALPYYGATAGYTNPVFANVDPYLSTTQSPNLRVIQTLLNPIYKVKNDIAELDVEYAVIPQLTFTSQTAFSNDFLWSTEDYNRFNTRPGVFDTTSPSSGLKAVAANVLSSDGYFCDPQLGCSNRLVAQDLVKAKSWQGSQEFRLESRFSGPLNFSFGGNYLHYETHENYYVFINSLSLFSAYLGAYAVGNIVGNTNLVRPYVPGVTTNTDCLRTGPQPGDVSSGYGILGCIVMDPHSLESVDDTGHNYFLSQNPYVLNSYASFGEANYAFTKDLKLMAGLRWTEDRKHFPIIPSWLLANSSYGYPVAKVIDQQWDELTGRLVANWTPNLAFTDQTLLYGSYSHGYKAGGANPPLPIPTGPNNVGLDSGIVSATHPETFKPEFIDAFELGTKNTLLDGALTLNASAFYYNYENYQISEIVDRTSVNLNFDAHVRGAELEATYEPVPGLRFNLAGGYEDARLAKGSKAVDLMDRTAGQPGWIVLKPFVTNPSNCIVPAYIFTAIVQINSLSPTTCGMYDPDDIANHTDPFAGRNLPGYPGFDPASAPNNGEGFDKDLSHNQMPNAPPFTLSAGAQYSRPITSEWAGTLRGDFYWQSDSFWRVFNDLSYDRLHGYTNFNLTLIFTNQNGWQVMLYDKNIFNTTAITGAFLNSDDSGLTTNAFLTDPKLVGIRVTKNW